MNGGHGRLGGYLAASGRRRRFDGLHGPPHRCPARSGFPHRSGLLRRPQPQPRPLGFLPLVIQTRHPFAGRHRSPATAARGLPGVSLGCGGSLGGPQRSERRAPTWVARRQGRAWLHTAREQRGQRRSGFPPPRWTLFSQEGFLGQHNGESLWTRRARPSLKTLSLFYAGLGFLVTQGMIVTMIYWWRCQTRPCSTLERPWLITFEVPLGFPWTLILGHCLA